jgi:transposase
MLIMETIAKVRRLYYVENKGFKTIARELRLSKNTVKNILKNDKTKLEYPSRQYQHYPVLGGHKEQLMERLSNDLEEPKRRRRTAKKLHRELQAEGYEGSYDAVHAFVKQWHMDHKSQGLSKAFIPLEFEAGEAFQFDWSEEEIELDGSLTRIKVAHIRLCYSRYFLMIAYPNEQLEMVLDAHNQAFLFFEGVCRKGIYDNMKTAIKTVLLGKEREYNARFLQMCSHHLFEPIACTPSSGWEKGQVENQVNTGRCNFFTPLVKVATLDELNAQLQASCIAWAKTTQHPEWKARTVFEVYQEEIAKLIPYRGPFDSYKVINEVVSPYSFVLYATNNYSVDINYVGQAVQVRIYAKQIIIEHQAKIIGNHPRCFGRHERIYDPWHYVPLLERKPGALRNGAPFKRLRLPVAMQSVRKQLSHYSDPDRRFIRILLYVIQYGLEAVEEACRVALLQGGCNDTVILSYLKPPVEQPLEQAFLIKLSAPPTEDCHSYNQAYLPQTMNNVEVSHVA